jgi:hypothetical protein
VFDPAPVPDGDAGVEDEAVALDAPPDATEPVFPVDPEPPEFDV